MCIATSLNVMYPEWRGWTGLLEICIYDSDDIGLCLLFVVFVNLENVYPYQTNDHLEGTGHPSQKLALMFRNPWFKVLNAVFSQCF